MEVPGTKLHMTGKPLALMEDLLRIVEPGGIVLDPFAGSGTTLVALSVCGLTGWASKPALTTTKLRIKDSKRRFTQVPC